MYAIVNISGKQFRAEKGKSLKVPNQNIEVGEKLSYDQVLLTNDNGEVQIGNPFIKNFKVSATVLENGRDKKRPEFTDHYFSGDYPVELIDQKSGALPSQLSLLIEAKK